MRTLVTAAQPTKGGVETIGGEIDSARFQILKPAGGTGTCSSTRTATAPTMPPGEWIAFPRAEGVILIARNRENAAATAGLAEGDTLIVRSLPEN